MRDDFDNRWQGVAPLDPPCPAAATLRLRKNRNFSPGISQPFSAAFERTGKTMKTQYFTATSLDGFIATEDDSLDWLFPLGDLEASTYPEFIAEVGSRWPWGSATYEWMLRNADRVAAEAGSPWPYMQPAWIFSSRALPAIDGADLRFVQGDVRPVHAPHAGVGGRKEHLDRRGAETWRGSSTMPACWTNSSSRSARPRWAGASRCFPRRVLSPCLDLSSVRRMGGGMGRVAL